MQASLKLQEHREGIAERLKFVLKDITQSEMSRRTGLPTASIHHYTKGARISAEFCSALVREFGINPAWLLSGEGTVYLADVSSGTASFANDILDLVRALKAVAKMKLGALAGKEHQKVLRSLHDSVLEYEDVAEKLGEAITPLFAKLLDQVQQALVDKKPKQARGLISACELLSRLCKDEALLQRLEGCSAFLYSQQGNYEAAYAYGRRSFLRKLVAGKAHPEMPFDASFIQSAYFHVVNLRTLGRLEDARRVCHAANTLAGNGQDLCNDSAAQKRYQNGSRLMEVLEATTELELGEIESALSRMRKVYGALDDEFRPRAIAYVFDAFFQAGMMSFKEILAYAGDFDNKGILLATLSCWTEDRELLLQAVPHIKEAQDARDNDIEDVIIWTQCVLDASNSRKQAPLLLLQKRLMQHSYPPLVLFRRFVDIAQVARLVGKTSVATRAVRDADKTLQGIGAGHKARVIDLALHYRNVLFSFKANSRSELRERAQSFMKEHYDAGYYFLKAFVKP